MILLLRVLAILVPVIVAGQLLRGHPGIVTHGVGEVAWFEWFYGASGVAFGAIMYWVSLRLADRN